MDVSRSGSIHGRFQPFHKGHLEYAMAAAQKVSHLFVGLTQPDLEELRWTPSAEHRVNPVDNPLTYYERLRLITASLMDEGLSGDFFTMVPFPIETPTKLGSYLPNDVTCYTTVYEEWNLRKIALLEEYGYPVEVLWTREEKAVNGSVVRQQILEGSSTWMDLVPNAAIPLIQEFGLRERLVGLTR